VWVQSRPFAPALGSANGSTETAARPLFSLVNSNSFWPKRRYSAPPFRLPHRRGAPQRRLIVKNNENLQRPGKFLMQRQRRSAGNEPQITMSVKGNNGGDFRPQRPSWPPCWCPRDGRPQGAPLRIQRAVTNRAGPIKQKTQHSFSRHKARLPEARRLECRAVEQTPDAMIRPGAVREFQFHEYADLPGWVNDKNAHTGIVRSNDYSLS
jgi:hypothetical protein